MANNFGYWLISAGAVGFIAERILNEYFSYRRREDKRLREKYRHEFGMDAPKYLLSREVREQLNARREMRR